MKKANMIATLIIMRLSSLPLDLVVVLAQILRAKFISAQKHTLNFERTFLQAGL
jgi:hypothetical protein